jgi:hypothetical protein
MPTPRDQLPATTTSLARRVADLARQLDELRAARRLAAAVAIEPWQNLALGNDWTQAAGWQVAQLRRQIDGAVQLRGSVAPGTLTDGTAIGMLPSGYWPPDRLEFRVGGGAASSSADLYVNTDGTITIQNSTGTISRISLTVIRIPATA